MGCPQNNRLKNRLKSQVEAIGFPLPDQKRQPSNSKTRAHDTGREMLAQLPQNSMTRLHTCAMRLFIESVSTA